MVVPDKLLGWNYELNDVEKSIILDKYQDLPNFGMGDAVNYEAVIAANPTIAINSGKINDAMVLIAMRYQKAFESGCCSRQRA